MAPPVGRMESYVFARTQGRGQHGEVLHSTETRGLTELRLTRWGRDMLVK